MREVGEHLLLELRPVSAGDDGHFRNRATSETAGHLGVDRRLALGKRAIEIENDQLFHFLAFTLRQRNVQERDRAACPAATCSDFGWQEEEVASPDRIVGSRVLQLAFSGDATSTRGVAAAPTTNGPSPWTRDKPKCSQQKSNSRRTGEAFLQPAYRTYRAWQNRCRQSLDRLAEVADSRS